VVQFGSVWFAMVRFPLDGQTRCHSALIQSPGVGDRARRVLRQPPPPWASNFAPRAPFYMRYKNRLVVFFTLRALL